MVCNTRTEDLVRRCGDRFLRTHLPKVYTERCEQTERLCTSLTWRPDHLAVRFDLLSAFSSAAFVFFLEGSERNTNAYSVTPRFMMCADENGY